MRLDYLTIQDKNIYLNLIGEFGDCDLTDEQWITFFEEYDGSDIRVIYMARVFDKVSNQDVVVGTVSFLVEMKAHRGMKNCVHIEDVVILEVYRKLSLGKQMMKLAIEEAKTYNSYKIILDCDSQHVDFYKKCGFYSNETQMRLDC